jgi:hypothetical protein
MFLIYIKYPTLKNTANCDDDLVSWLNAHVNAALALRDLKAGGLKR